MRTKEKNGTTFDREIDRKLIPSSDKGFFDL